MARPTVHRLTARQVPGSTSVSNGEVRAPLAEGRTNGLTRDRPAHRHRPRRPLQAARAEVSARIRVRESRAAQISRFSALFILPIKPRHGVVRHSTGAPKFDNYIGNIVDSV